MLENTIMDGDHGSFNKQTGWKASEAQVEGCGVPCVMYMCALKNSSPEEVLARLMPLNTQLFLLRLDSASTLHAYVILWLKAMRTWVQRFGFFFAAGSFDSSCAVPPFTVLSRLNDGLFDFLRCKSYSWPF